MSKAVTIDSVLVDHNALANYTDEQLEALLNSTEVNDGDTASEETPALTETKVEQKEAKKEDEVIDGVLARDGKNIIPFSVLDATRTNLSQAEQRAKDAEQAKLDAEAKLTAMQDKLLLLQSGVESNAEVLNEDELTELEKEMPLLGKTIREQQAQIAQLQDKLKNQHVTTQKTQAELQAQAIQSAIDANPKLSLLQSQGNDGYEAAKRIDRVLRDDPKFANLSLSERFDKVIELYEESYGSIKIASKNDVDLKKATEKALADAPKKEVPKSMSDIPGGTPPAVDELAAIENKSGVELEQMFSKMSPKQIEDYLNRL